MEVAELPATATTTSSPAWATARSTATRTTSSTRSSGGSSSATSRRAGDGDMADEGGEHERSRLRRPPIEPWRERAPRRRLLDRQSTHLDLHARRGGRGGHPERIRRGAGRQGEIDENCQSRQRLLSASLMAVAVSVAVAGARAAPCAPSDKSSTAYGTLEYVDNLNPFIGYSGVDYMIYQLNYDFLVGFEPEKLQPRPEFAESWTTRRTASSWTFKIRPGMTWQDGEPATARDVAFTFNYIIENELADFISYPTFIEKVTALDDLTVQFECSKPKGDILSMKVPILPEHIWSKVSASRRRGVVHQRPAVHRLRSLAGGRAQAERLHAPCGQPRLRGWQAEHGRDPAHHLPERRHDGAGPQVGGAGRLHRRAPRPSSRVSPRTPSRPPGSSRGRSSSSPSTATTAPTRRATRCCSTRPSARRCSTPSTVRATRRPPTAGYMNPGGVAAAAVLRVLLGARQRCGLHVRSGQGPGDARRRRLQGRGRRRLPRDQGRQTAQAASLHRLRRRRRTSRRASSPWAGSGTSA